MKKRTISLLLAFVLALGLVPTAAVAYTTPDFSDVPSNHWAYEAVMKMADAGVIKGTGNGKFSPDMKLSAEMFVVLVGRVVFPDVKAEGSDWSGPYVAEAKEKGLLTGTNVTDANIKGDISRYDMAVILAKCVELLKVSATKADSSKVADYGEVPTKYVDAVLTAYGSGLIRGDQSGSFNGQNSMTRQEAATVMDRLLGLKGGNSQSTTEPEKPTDPEKEQKPPVEDNKYAQFADAGCMPRDDYNPSAVERIEGTSVWIDREFRSAEVRGTSFAGYVYFNVGDTYQFAIQEVPAGYGYNEGDLNERVQYWLGEIDPEWNGAAFKDFKVWTTDDPSVATVDQNGFVTIVGPGEAHIRVELPVVYYNKIWTIEMDSILLLVDP